MKTFRWCFLAGALLSLMGCRSVESTNGPELPRGRVMTVGGYRLFLRQTGTGPDVVLLHGLGDSSLGWQFIEPDLVRAGYRVTVWDGLGAGRSERPAHADYSVQAHVKRLEETLDALGIRKAVIVGHSLGGSEALLFAERNPGRVRALCLIDPAAYRAGALHGRWFWTTPLVAETVLTLVPAKSITRYGLEQNFYDQEAISHELERMYLREVRRDGAVRFLIAQERQIVPRDPEKCEDAHRTIRKRTLILWGKEDKLVPVAQGERLAKDIDGARLVIFPGIGHSPQLEAPQSVLYHVLPFLEKVGLE